MEGSPDMPIVLLRAAAPWTTSNADLGNRQDWASSATIASFALPSSGGAVTATLSPPWRVNSSAVRRARGCARRLTVTPLIERRRKGGSPGGGDVAAGVSAAERARDTPTTGCAGRKGRAAG